jgi:hypothetical protein
VHSADVGVGSTKDPVVVGEKDISGVVVSGGDTGGVLMVGGAAACLEG